MEIVPAIVFVPLIIIAVTQMIKMASPLVKGWLTVGVALVLGALLALVDIHIGMQDITVAQGVVMGLGAVGITTATSKAGYGTAGDQPHM